MTGTRRSSRHHAIPEEDKPNHADKQSGPKSLPDGDSTSGKRESNTKNSKKEVISGVRRNSNDDDIEFYYTRADKWVPGDETPPELLRVWAKEHMILSSRPIPDSEFEVNNVTRNLAVGLMVHCRQIGRDKSGNIHPYRWIPVQAACPKATSAWAKVAKERLEDQVKHLEKDQISSYTARRLRMLEDLLDGEIIPPDKPDWMSDTSAEDQDTKISPHPPHYPLPTPFDGDCDHATNPSSIITHTKLVAACQASKHLPNALSPDPSPHLVCTACHVNPPTQRLTQHEIDHIIRDKGLFPLCSFCTETWCKPLGVDAGEECDNCT